MGNLLSLPMRAVKEERIGERKKKVKEGASAADGGGKRQMASAIIVVRNGPEVTRKYVPTCCSCLLRLHKLLTFLRL